MNEILITHTPLIPGYPVETDSPEYTSSETEDATHGPTLDGTSEFVVGDGSMPRLLVLKAIGANQSDFLKQYSQKFGEKKAELVRAAIDDICGDISSGLAYGRMHNRNLRFLDGRVRDKSGKTDDPYRVATYFINKVLDTQYESYSKYKLEEEDKLKAEQTYSYGVLNNNFMNYQFAGDATPEMAAAWQLASVADRIASYRNFIAQELLNLNKYKYTEGYNDVEDVRQRLLAADAALLDGDVSTADLLILGRAGIRGNIFAPEQTTQTAQAELDRPQTESSRYTEILNQLYNLKLKAWNDYQEALLNMPQGDPTDVRQYTTYAGKDMWSELLKKAQKMPALRDAIKIGLTKWYKEDQNKSSLEWSNETKILALALGLTTNGSLNPDDMRGAMLNLLQHAYASAKPGEKLPALFMYAPITVDNGFYLPVGVSADITSGTVLLYNANQGTYGRYYLNSLPPTTRNEILKIYERDNGLTNPSQAVPQSKFGGVLKALLGSVLLTSQNFYAGNNDLFGTSPESSEDSSSKSENTKESDKLTGWYTNARNIVSPVLKGFEFPMRKGVRASFKPISGEFPNLAAADEAVAAAAKKAAHKASLGAYGTLAVAGADIYNSYANMKEGRIPAWQFARNLISDALNAAYYFGVGRTPGGSKFTKLLSIGFRDLAGLLNIERAGHGLVEGAVAISKYIENPENSGYSKEDYFRILNDVAQGVFGLINNNQAKAGGNKTLRRYEKPSESDNKALIDELKKKSNFNIKDLSQSGSQNSAGNTSSNGGTSVSASGNKKLGGVLELYKKGGVLFDASKPLRPVMFAQNGAAASTIPTWADITGKLANTWNTTVEKAGKRVYDTTTLRNADFNLGYNDAWTSPDDAKQAGAYYAAIPTGLGYKPNGTQNGNYIDYVKEIENTPYYQQFHHDLFDYEADGKTINYNNGRGGLSEMGMEFAKQTDKYIKNPADRIFKDPENNVFNDSWKFIGTNANGVKSNITYTNAALLLAARRLDHILGTAHNVFTGKGNRYYRKLANDTKLYLDADLIEQYKDKGIYTIGGPEVLDYDATTQTQWTDFEVKGLNDKNPKVTETPEGDTEGDTKTGSFLSEGYPKDKTKPDYLNNFWLNAAGYLSGLPRIAMLNNAAKKTRDIIKKLPMYLKLAPWYLRLVTNDNLGNLVANNTIAQARAVASDIANNSTDLNLAAATRLQGEALNALTALAQAQRDKAYIDERRKAAETVGDTNITNMVGTANDNRQLRWSKAHEDALADIEYLTKRANNWNSWMMEKEYDLKTDLARLKAERDAWNLRNLQTTDENGNTVVGGSAEEFAESILANDDEYQKALGYMLEYQADPAAFNEKYKNNKDINIASIITNAQKKAALAKRLGLLLYRLAYAKYKNFPYMQPTKPYSPKEVSNKASGGTIRKTTKKSNNYEIEQLKLLGKDADRFMRSMSRLHDRNAALVSKISIPYVLEVMKIQK